jgi:uncharacterized YigZ family protein
MESDSYLSIKAISQGLFKEKGSRFIAMAYPVTKQQEIKSILENIRKEHHAARHHCYAWMLGQDRQTFRISDDGEPSGSAGRPILGQINAFYLTNILIVVVRYFGGKLLGVSGLINAYRSAAESAINNSEITEHYIRDYFELIFPYTSVNDVMKIIKDDAIAQSDQKFELKCSLTINFRTSVRGKILQALSRIDGLQYRQTGSF